LSGRRGSRGGATWLAGERGGRRGVDGVQDSRSVGEVGKHGVCPCCAEVVGGVVAARDCDDRGATLARGCYVVGGVADDDGVRLGEPVSVLVAGAALREWDEGGSVGGVVGVGADIEI